MTPASVKGKDKGDKAWTQRFYLSPGLLVPCCSIASRKPFLGISCPQVCDLQPQMGIPGAFCFECRRDHFSDKGEAFFETIS